MLLGLPLLAVAQPLQQAPFSGEFVEYQKRLSALGPMALQPKAADPGMGLGYRPAPVDMSHLSVQLAPGKGATLPTKAAPASFDWRGTAGKLPAVRDQNPYGTCWAFATFASMESFLRTGETPDYSERHMAFTHGWDWGYNSGGNQWVSTAYLSRWAGPIDEADCPYSGMPTAPSGSYTVRKHLQEALFYPSPDPANATVMDLVKNAIMANGALHVSYYHDNAYYNATNKAYYY
jgi:C1A family cysteine protease